MTKFSDRCLKWNRPNHECIDPKLNGNRPILQMAIAEGGMAQIAMAQQP